MSETPNLPPPRCKNLCCKAMLVYGEDFESDPDYVAGLTDFWCTLTAKSQGPDSEYVSLELCSNPERSCYQAY